jgi:hypothetical protein
MPPESRFIAYLCNGRLNPFVFDELRHHRPGRTEGNMCQKCPNVSRKMSTSGAQTNQGTNDQLSLGYSKGFTSNEQSLKRALHEALAN